jgi:CheY-like chemotaxis protein
MPSTSTSIPALERPLLLAEDDYELRRLLGSMLRHDGYAVVEARNGSELLNYVAASLLYSARYAEPALILTDVRMPGPSGLDVGSALKRTRYRSPLVVMTAFGGDDMRRQARVLGAVAVLDKPFELEELRRIVQRWAPLPAAARIA